MFWRGIIVGLALGVWVASLALWSLWQEAESAPAQCSTCCGGCGQDNHAHPPPVNIAWAPTGDAQYFCGRSDHGGGFLWDHAGGYVWDHGAGYLWDHGGGSLWDHGGGFVWDHGGGYVWDHGGGFLWDHGGGFVWDADLSDRQPLPGSPTVPVPGPELANHRGAFEYRCAEGAGGINDVSVVREGVKMSIVMPNGNILFKCAVDGVTGGAKIVDRGATGIPADNSPDRAYCLVADGTPHEYTDQDWAP